MYFVNFCDTCADCAEAGCRSEPLRGGAVCGSWWLSKLSLEVSGWALGMGVTRNFSREGHNFLPKIFFAFLHKKLKNGNFFCKFAPFWDEIRGINTIE